MYQEVFQLHANLLKALAHPKRLEIINLLQSQELSVTDMQEMLGLPQANLSQHLMLLRKYGVVESRKTGKQVWYRMTHRNFVKAGELIRQVLVERYEKKPLAAELSKSLVEFLPIATDPVCGMRLPAKTASASVAYQQQQYYFCASGCQQKFLKAPNRYMVKTARKQRIESIPRRFRQPAELWGTRESRK